MRHHAVSAAIAAAVALAFVYDAPAYAQAAKPAAQREPIYGYTMMSDAERNEYREKMRNARTADERQSLRDEHRKTMEARMKERGVEPGQMRGRGAGPGGPGKGGGPGGPGYGKGGGPGYGQGAGPGYGKGPRGPGAGPGPGAGGSTTP